MIDAAPSSRACRRRGATGVELGELGRPARRSRAAPGAVGGASGAGAPRCRRAVPADLARADRPPGGRVFPVGRRRRSSTRSRAVASAPCSAGVAPSSRIRASNRSGGRQDVAGEVLPDDAARPAGLRGQLPVGQQGLALLPGFAAAQLAQQPGQLGHVSAPPRARRGSPPLRTSVPVPPVSARRYPLLGHAPPTPVIPPPGMRTGRVDSGAAHAR